MTQQEFESRVAMQVSAIEYQAIEIVYMHADVDKDEFCRLWVKMNQNRVKAAKEAAKAEAAAQQLRENLWGILNKFEGEDYMWKVQTLVHTALSEKEEKTVQAAGIPLKHDRYFYYNMADILWAIRKYLGIVK